VALPSIAFAQGGFAEMPSHTQFFIVVGIALTIWFAFARFDRFAVMHGPEILTTVGIFGCFLGVSIGLWSFDPNNVGTSVPKLLEGIRTAFSRLPWRLRK
jgi:hypothetical protein